MTGIEYRDLAHRLTPEADQIFCEMALAHLEAGSGDRLFIRSDTLSGTGLHFRGPNTSKRWQGFDGGLSRTSLATTFSMSAIQAAEHRTIASPAKAFTSINGSWSRKDRRSHKSMMSFADRSFTNTGGSCGSEQAWIFCAT
ncbi:MAG: hypothetical protein U9N79_08720 [Actinomycetota bacterium]|nr:hypothetical protein [Actinomycetota bacterium]